jgi:uncharacterized RDD family membrane protein YckC
MRCVNCSGDLPEQGAFCPGCGQPVLRVAVPVATTLTAPSPDRTPPPKPPVAGRSVVYAGLWLRLVAYLIDSVVLAVPAALLLTIVGPSLGVRVPLPLVPRDPATLHGLYQLDFILLGVAWLYFALLESSPWQATLGKRMLGLVVTDLDGKRISFTRASMRFFGKLISSMTLLIGYFMVGFTRRKQALHDILASCLVIRKV